MSRLGWLLLLIGVDFLVLAAFGRGAFGVVLPITTVLYVFLASRPRGGW